MPHPFQSSSVEGTDLDLIAAAQEGSAAALEALIRRHQHYIYNLALKFVLSPFDAEDITQEVLVKVVTKLGQFEGKSSFRTWLYRITFNHFLKMKKYWLEEAITSFDAYGQDLDGIAEVDLSPEEQLARRELIEEAKLSCLSGMLLCLDRDQRLVYLLGEVFGADHGIGAELLEISPANYRKRLERARRDLRQFMNRQCGLVNPANPCRCARKTMGFIQAGWVDPGKMKFNTAYVRSVAETLPAKSDQFDALVEDTYAALFRDTPFQEKPHAERLMRRLFEDPEVRAVFDLGE